MSEMVERVAKDLVKWQGLPESAWVDHVEMARTAIEAMRKPTDAMLAAACACPGDGNLATDAQNTWNAMIDAALTPPAS